MLRQTFRNLARTPAFTAIVVLTVALGISVTAAIFSIVNGTIFRSLPFPAPAQLVAVSESTPGEPDSGFVNAKHFLEWRKQASGFQSLALVSALTRNLTGSGDPERLLGARVSAALFPMLGIQPQLGRAFLDAEDHAGANRVVILSQTLWAGRFASNPAILGTTIQLDGDSYQIVGVMPADLPQAAVGGIEWSREPTQFWTPFALQNSELYDFGDFDYECIGRLRPGVSVARAQAQLDATESRIAATLPMKTSLSANVLPLESAISGKSRHALLLLLAAVGTVLAISCVNVANLLLTRGAARTREFAVRSALGARGRRLIAQMLLESMLLAGFGGVLGVALTYSGFGFLIAHAPADLPRLDEVRIDARVLLFSIAATVLTGLLCGLLPAWRASRADPLPGLRSGGRNATKTGHRLRIQSRLVAFEVALSAVCLLVLGLLVHSFVALLRTNRGFDVERVLTVDLSLSGNRYSDLQQRTHFWERLLPKVAALPGVTSVAISNRLPLSGAGTDNWLIPEGKKTALSDRPVADMRFVNPEFFRTLAIPLDVGRIFSPVDQNARVAVISARTAKALFPNSSAMGKRFHLGDEDSPLITVLGVAGDVRANGLERQPKFTIYIPFWQRDRSTMTLAVRAAANPASLIAAVRREIRKADIDLPVPAFRTMSEILDASLGQRRFQIVLLGAFGVLALLLSSLGVYGIVAYAAGQRRAEMGIRLALGAQPSHVGSLVLRQGLGPVLRGLLSGIVFSLSAHHFLATLLFGIQPYDPAALLTAVLPLTAAAAFACSIPAARAMRIDPMRTLRGE